MNKPGIYITATIPPPAVEVDVNGPPAYYMRWIRAIGGLTVAESKELFEKTTGWDTYFPSNNDSNSDRFKRAEENRNKILNHYRANPLTVTLPRPFTKMDAYMVVHKYSAEIKFSFSTDKGELLG